jgi:hypothetical protein
MLKGQQVTLEIPRQFIYRKEIKVLQEIQANSARLKPAPSSAGTSRSKVGSDAIFFAPIWILWLFGFVVHSTQPNPDSP